MLNFLLAHRSHIYWGCFLIACKTWGKFWGGVVMILPKHFPKTSDVVKWLEIFSDWGWV